MLQHKGKQRNNYFSRIDETRNEIISTTSRSTRTKTGSKRIPKNKDKTKNTRTGVGGLPMDKGISSIVTTILLLLIAVSIAGGFFLWVSRQQSLIQDATQDQIQTEVAALEKTINIANVVPSNGGISIRNTGTANISVIEISIYKNGILLIPGVPPGSGWSDDTDLPPQGFRNYIHTLACAAGDNITAISPGTLKGDRWVC